MSKKILSPTLFAIAFCLVMFQSCLKDTGTKTYTIFSPVYTSKQTARNAIKSDAAQPIVSPGKLFVLGNYIFLNEVDKGIHVIDNSNPADPINKYFIPIIGNVDLAVKGTTLYADMFRDLLAIDISNPAALKVKKVVENVFPPRMYSNGYAGDTSMFITGWIKKDTTISYEQNRNYLAEDNFYTTSQSSSGFATAAPVGISGSMARFTLMNNHLYTVTNEDLNVFNIAQPQNPVFTSKIPVGWRIETIYPFQNNLFIGSANGMFIYSTADPAYPSLLSQFSHITSCDPVIADSNFAFVTLRSGNNCAGFVNQLEILNIQNVQSPTLVKSYDLTNPHGLSKSGNILFICDGTGGLKIFDASDVNNLNLLRTIGGLNAYDIITINNNAIVVAADGLYQYDYSDPANTTLRSKISL